MSRHSYTSVLEYIPQRYAGLDSKQQKDRQTVYLFKEGICTPRVISLLMGKIKDVVGSNPSEWVVCFIPASTKIKHLKRYSCLCDFLNSHSYLACPAYIDAIDVAYDRESGHISGKSDNPTDNMQFRANRFAGKKVVLVDDVRTRGVTFDRTADKLVSLGAVEVFGVFLAQTVHPNLPVGTTHKKNTTGYNGGLYNGIPNSYLEYRMEIQEQINQAFAYKRLEEQMAQAEKENLRRFGIYI